MARFPGCISSIALRALLQAGALFALLLAIAAPALAGSITLAWDPVTSPLVAGYVIHYGPGPGNYTASIDAGSVTTRTLSDLTEGATYHFAAAAYDAAHIEGALSNDVAGAIPYSGPVANFSASTVTGPAPLVLNFINSSTGVITSYAWTFGDSTTSTVANPAKVYSTPGSYTVGLTVNGPGGSNVKTRPNYIIVTATGDTTPPSAPGTPTATAASSTTINLSWTPAPTTSRLPATWSSVARARAARPSPRSRRRPERRTTIPASPRIPPTATGCERPTPRAISVATPPSRGDDVRRPDTTPPSAPGLPPRPRLAVRRST